MYIFLAKQSIVFYLMWRVLGLLSSFQVIAWKAEIWFLCKNALKYTKTDRIIIRPLFWKKAGKKGGESNAKTHLALTPAFFILAAKHCHFCLYIGNFPASKSQPLAFLRLFCAEASSMTQPQRIPIILFPARSSRMLRLGGYIPRRYRRFGHR